jgi:hypothetical protein
MCRIRFREVGDGRVSRRPLASDGEGIAAQLERGHHDNYLRWNHRPSWFLVSLPGTREPIAAAEATQTRWECFVAVELAERPTVAARSAEGDQSVVATLTARIETLESEFAKVEAAAAVHRADFERERERCERLMAEVLKATAELMVAREATARLAGELAAIQARPWWRRLVG